MNLLLGFALLLICASIFVNGWTDAPNAIATVVSTRVLHPRAAIRDFQMVRCGNGTNLEIFEYSAPDQNRRLPRNSDIGGHHLAFYVDDMAAAVDYLKSRGVQVLDTPSTFTEGPAKGLTWVYFLAPWGLQLELVSFPEGMGYGRGLTRLFWDPRTPEH